MNSTASAICTVALTTTGLLFATASVQAQKQPSDEEVQFFEQRIRPLLVQHCYRCHSAKAKRVRGGLLLDTRAGLLKGGESGPALVPRHPEKSLLTKAVRYRDKDLQMPPDKKLSDREIASLEKWIRLGAPDPRSGTAPKGTQNEIDFDNARRFWSLQPVRDSELPALKNKDWSNNTVDHFVLAKLEAKGLRPALPARRRTLVRRATYDLIGLPPTPQQVEDFVNDPSPNAFAKVIDRLLASPQYGEKWGRHWLDLVRYADTSGCNSDFPIPQAYRYRNYVIDAFNDDKPYDRFVREQIAGDRMQSASTEQRHERIIATGFLALSRRFGSLDDENHLTLEDSIEVIGTSMLGLSVNCARCHDHKFDPIPQRDYYALYGILESTRYAFPGTEIYRWPRDLYPLVKSRNEEKKLQAHLDKTYAMDAEYRRLWLKWLTTDTGPAKNKARATFQAQGKKRDQLNKRAPAYDKAYAVLDGTPHNARFHVKGDPTNLGDEVPRGFLTVLGGQSVSQGQPTSGRLQLANWLTNVDNPLTARVMVNRIWQHHFGRGLVATPNDFGTRGQRPSHPQLLDYLANRFVAEGWSVKKMHRRLMLSATYRQAGRNDASFARVDPDNVLLWKFRRRRLTAEEVRDGILAVSGQLDRAKGGAHPFPPAEKWRYTQHRPFYAVYPSKKRSVYLMQQRIRKHPFFKVFDGADTNATTAQRSTSITPVQALFLMNNELVHEQSDAWAESLLSESTDAKSRIKRAYEQALGRTASNEEIAMGMAYLQQCRSKLSQTTKTAAGQRERTAWASYLRVLLSSSEFLFVD